MSHPDAFNPPTFHAPDRTTSPSIYTYPPQGPTSYDHVPNSAGLSRPASGPILPTHMNPQHTPLSPNPVYPPLANSWARIRAWLSREYPELGDTLNYGIIPTDLAQVEMQFGFALPPVVRESYLICDGQEAESAAGCSEGLFFGLRLLPLEDVYDEWKFWREVDSDPATGANEKLREIMQSAPPGWVRKEYSQRGWIPLIADRVGNYIGVDLNPAEGGQVGQVIVFGRDFDTKVVLWRGDGLAGWAKWLAAFAEELDSGEGFELGPAEVSDDSEDELGYESYFYDGKGRGQGDGGGDTGGVGGLRLTGEYKGWNVMEAWADRSLRKWQEAGVITNVPVLSSDENLKGKGTDKVGLGVIDVNHGSGAEIPIPILADVDEPIPPPTGLGINGKRASQNIPTISVTKAPAPRPVVLPTVSDILEPSSRPDSLEGGGDLEAGLGNGLSMANPSSTSLSEPKLSPSITRRPVQPPSIHPVSHGVADSLAEMISPVDVTTPLVSAMSDPLTDVPQSQRQPEVVVKTDLLADSVISSLDASPIELNLASESNLAPVIVAEKAVAESPKLVDAEFVAEGEEKGKTEEPPENTIRLIGGGGTSGSAPPEVQLDGDVEPALVASPVEVQKQKDSDASGIQSVDSSSGITKQQSPQVGHTKTKSGLGGLRRLSGFGNLKKKGSVGSIKESQQ